MVYFNCLGGANFAPKQKKDFYIMKPSTQGSFVTAGETLTHQISEAFQLF